MSRSSRLLANLREVRDVLDVPFSVMLEASGMSRGGFEHWLSGERDGRNKGYRCLEGVLAICRKQGLDIDEVLEEAERRSTEKALLKEKSL